MIFTALFWCVFSIVFAYLGLACLEGSGIFPWVIWGSFLAIALIYRGRKSLILSLCVVLCAIYGNWRFELATPKPIPPREVRATLIVEKIFRSFGNKTSGIGSIGSVQGLHLKFLKGDSVYFSLPLGKDSKPMERGQQWNVTGVLTTGPIRFPEHKFGHFLWTNDIHYKITRVRTLERCMNTHESLFFRCNRYCERILSKGSDKDSEAAHTYKAMLLGRKEYLSPSTFKDFTLTGTLHLLAVSGLHVGVISIVVFGFLKFFPCSRPLRLLCALCVVGFYVFVVGNSPSTLRAFVMVATWVFAQLFYRQIRGEGTFLVALFIVLLWNPKQLFDVGFQLSYGIVGALIWFGAPLANQLRSLFLAYQYIPQKSLSLFQKYKLSIQQWMISAFSVSLAATILSQILMAYYWQYLTPWALLLNMFVIPLASFAVAFGGCALLVGSILPWFPLVDIFNWIAVQSIKALIFILSKAAILPGASIAFKLSLPYTSLSLGIFYLSALYFSSVSKRKKLGDTPFSTC